MIAYNCIYCKKHDNCKKREKLKVKDLLMLTDKHKKNENCYIPDEKKIYRRGEIKIKEKRRSVKRKRRK